LGVNPYSVNIIGLTNKAHSFDYQFNDEFFVRYSQDLVTGGDFKATVLLDKSETFINAEFKIKGHAALICDRSLDPFEFPIRINRKVVFKYGEEEKELGDDIYTITHDTHNLDLGQLMYEFIALEIPIRKLHPRFKNEEESDDENEEGKVIYTSSTEKEEDDKMDPRWEQLKKLK
jgi:uncharacterized metal-binding protein YceD (DUF177 family)